MSQLAEMDEMNAFDYFVKVKDNYKDFTDRWSTLKVW